MYSDSRIKKYFSKAKNASMLSDFNRQHLGCVFIHKNKVISVGYNTSKENPMQKHYNWYRGYNPEETLNSLHAEMKCLVETRGLDVDWKNVSVFVYRQKKNGEIALAKPCKACRKAMIDRGIREFYYTTDDGYAYEKIN